MTSLLDSSSNFFCSFEKLLNRWGAIPFVGILTGLFRILFGILQYQVGAILALIACIVATVLQSGNKPSAQSWDRFLRFCVKQTINGPLNIVRGAIEFFPFAGGAITKSYDELRTGGPIVSYHVEK